MDSSARIEKLEAALDDHVETILGSFTSKRRVKRATDDAVKADIIQSILSMGDGFSSQELAEHYNVSTEVVAAMRAWVTMYRRNGLSDEEILAKYGVEVGEEE